MRISDWSSDVCSSDLRPGRTNPPGRSAQPLGPSDLLRRRCQGLYRLSDAGNAERSGLNEGRTGPPSPAEGGPLEETSENSGRMQEWRSTQWLRSRSTTARDMRRSEEHTSELQSLMRISYAVFCLKKKNTTQQQ